METIRDAPELYLRDLHPHVDPESALVLARRLVREGLLEATVDE
jgi:hypothetical protein